MNEFLAIISDLSEQLDPVSHALVDLSPLQCEPSPAMQSLEAQFKQRSAVVLSAAEHTEYVHVVTVKSIRVHLVLRTVS